MEFLQTLICIIVFLLTLPYIRLIFIRTKASVRIRKACRENGFTLISAHPFPFLGLNFSDKADFLVKENNGGRVYCVKLFGTLLKGLTLYFIDGDKYRFINEASLLSHVNNIPLLSLSRGTGTRKMSIDYYSRFDRLEDTDFLRPIPVILVCPVPLAVRRAKTQTVKNSTMMRPGYLFEKHSETESKPVGKIIYDGDFIHDEYLFSAASFCSELFSSCIERE